MTAPRRIDTTQAGASVAFGSVGAAYSKLLGPIAGRGISLHIVNTLDKDVWISLDGGTTDFLQIASARDIELNLGANGAHYSGTVSVKQGSAGAGSGFISCGVVRVL